MAKSPLEPRRFVPTLTQVVQTETESPGVPNLQVLTPEMQQELVMRVMQRLDVALEKKLPDAVARLVVAHMQLLGPELWDEVAKVVHESVEQAVAQELGLRRAPR